MRRSSLVAVVAALPLALTALPAAAAAPTGTGAAPRPAATRTAPAPVTRLRAYDGATGITVVWTDPTARFDHAVLRYARGPKAPGRHDGTTVRVARTAASATLTRLRHDTVYSVTVWAVDAHGDRSTPAHTRFTTDAAGRGRGTYTARYTDPAGHPLAGVETMAVDDSTGTGTHAVSGPDGRVSLSLPAGEVDIEAGGQQITGGSADATGYVGTSHIVTIRTGRTTGAGTIALRPGGALRIRAVDPSGSPIAGLVPSVRRATAYVQTTPPSDGDDGDYEGFGFLFAFESGAVDPTGENLFVYPIAPATFGTTGADGTFTIRGVRPGSRLVCFDPTSASGGASPAGYLPQCAGGTAGSTSRGTPVSVTAGGTTTVDVALSSAAGIAGRITFPASAQVQFPDLTVFRDGTVVTEVEPGRTGRYTVTGLVPGTYTVCADYITAGGEDVGRCYRDAAWNAERSSRPPSDATPVTATGNAVAAGIDITVPR